MDRKLAAIRTADVVGYSKLLGNGGGLPLNAKPPGVNSGHLFGKCEVGGATGVAGLEAGGRHATDD